MIALAFSGRPPTHRMPRAGYEAEKQLAFYLDRAFREAAFEFRVLHGLRFERQGDVAQIDHLVLHRFGFMLIESKSIVESISINEHGEFTRQYGQRAQGMPSPIAQARRQAHLLQLLLNDHKDKLRRKVGVGPLKRQGEFSDQRFAVIAAISDKGQIHCDGTRPAEVMKAEAVVEAVQQRVTYLHSLASTGGVARSMVAEFTNRQKAREWDENFIGPFTDAEIEAITDFLLGAHKPLTQAVPEAEPMPTATHAPAATAASAPPPTAQQSAKTTQPAAAPSSGADARKAPLRNMARWSTEEEDRLRAAFAAGSSPDTLTAAFGRTAKALRLRAHKMGLIVEVGDWK